MPKHFSENYERDERTYFDKDGVEIVSSYRFLLLADGASGFDSWVVLKSLVKAKIELIFKKSAWGLIWLSFRCEVEIVNSVEIPQDFKVTTTKSNKKGRLEKIVKEYGLQPELLNGEIEHSLIKRSNFADLRHKWVFLN